MLWFDGMFATVVLYSTVGWEKLAGFLIGKFKKKLTAL